MFFLAGGGMGGGSEFSLIEVFMDSCLNLFSVSYALATWAAFFCAPLG